MTDQPAALPPANWYPAPDRPGQVRWWDGTTWTDQYSPIDTRAAKRAAKDAAKAQKTAAKTAAHEQRDYQNATAVYQKALAAWQQQRDAAQEQLELVSTFTGDTSSAGLLLKNGEAVFARISGVSLVEDRAVQGHFEGRSQGVSIPIGSLGGHSVRYHVGQTRGHYVAAAPVATAIDVGNLVVTNQRVIFQGTKATRECLYSKMVGYQTSPNGAATFSVSNRQKPTVVHYGPQVAAEFDLYLELALAHYRGTVDELTARAQAALSTVDGLRPPAPTAP